MLDDELGESVAISSDGHKLAVSSNCCIRIYEFINSDWNQIGIINEGISYHSHNSVFLSDDGNTIAYGNMNNNPGYVKVYRYNDFSWNQLGSDIIGDPLYYNFGYSVSLSSNGEIIAISGISSECNSCSEGHVKVFNWWYLMEPNR